MKKSNILDNTKKNLKLLNEENRQLRLEIKKLKKLVNKSDKDQVLELLHQFEIEYKVYSKNHIAERSLEFGGSEAVCVRSVLDFIFNKEGRLVGTCIVTPTEFDETFKQTISIEKIQSLLKLKE